jgi:hypothetical protein
MTPGGELRGSGCPWKASSVTVKMDIRLKRGGMLCRHRVLLWSQISRFPPLVVRSEESEGERERQTHHSGCQSSLR